MRTPPLPADFIHTRVCKPKCENLLTLPLKQKSYTIATEKCRINERLKERLPNRKNGKVGALFLYTGVIKWILKIELSK